MIAVAIAKTAVPTVAAWTPSTSRGGTSACWIRCASWISGVAGTSGEILAGSLTH
jgi:hypothetical protein